MAVLPADNGRFTVVLNTPRLPQRQDPMNIYKKDQSQLEEHSSLYHTYGLQHCTRTEHIWDQSTKSTLWQKVHLITSKIAPKAAIRSPRDPDGFILKPGPLKVRLTTKGYHNRGVMGRWGNQGLIFNNFKSEKMCQASQEASKGTGSWIFKRAEC